MRKFAILILISIIFITNGFSQNVAINNNGAAPNTNAMLDVDVTTNDKGILIPRLSTAQRTAIAGLGAADEGLTVYDETTNSYWLWDGTQWVAFAMTGEAWQINGNTGITASHFLGTINSADLKFRTNNIERMSLENSGELIIGIGGTVDYATAQGDLYVRDIIEVDNNIYLGNYMYHGGDVDTYWRFGTDYVQIYAGGLEFLRLYEASQDIAVFNEYGEDVDFRIESDDKFDLFFINGEDEGGVFINSIGAISGDLFSVYADEAWNASNPWGVNSYNSYIAGGSGFFYNENTTNGYNAVEGITNYRGTTGAPAGVLGLAIENTASNTSKGVRGATNNTNGVGVEGSRTGTTNLAGFGGLFYNDLAFSGNVYNISDKKLKKNITALEGASAIDLIKKTKTYTFEWDLEKYPYLGLHSGTYYGFISQEVEEILPIAVADKILNLNACKEITDVKQAEEVDIIEVKMLDYMMYVPILTQAVKEQQLIIEDLEQRIVELEEKMKKMQ